MIITNIWFSQSYLLEKLSPSHSSVSPWDNILEKIYRVLDGKRQIYGIEQAS